MTSERELAEKIEQAIVRYFHKNRVSTKTDTLSNVSFATGHTTITSTNDKGEEEKEFVADGEPVMIYRLAEAIAYEIGAG